MTGVAIVTGATSGIGRAAAVELVRRGWHVVLASRSTDIGEAFVKELGQRSAFKRIDVAVGADSHELVAFAVERFGRLDVAVNNAGLEVRNKIDAFDERDYTRVFDTNVKGLFFAMEAQVAAMKRAGGGSIINVSSSGGSRGMSGMSIYSASKHAVEGLSRSAALELAKENIRVNVVAPGPIATPMLDRVTSHNHEAMVRRVPMGRTGKPEEVAHAIAWLASSESSFVTGAVIPVNGGMEAT